MWEITWPFRKGTKTVGPTRKSVDFLSKAVRQQKCSFGINPHLGEHYKRLATVRIGQAQFPEPFVYVLRIRVPETRLQCLETKHSLCTHNRTLAH